MQAMIYLITPAFRVSGREGGGVVLLLAGIAMFLGMLFTVWESLDQLNLFWSAGITLVISVNGLLMLGLAIRYIARSFKSRQSHSRINHLAKAVLQVNNGLPPLPPPLLTYATAAWFLKDGHMASAAIHSSDIIAYGPKQYQTFNNACVEMLIVHLKRMYMHVIQALILDDKWPMHPLDIILCGSLGNQAMLEAWQAAWLTTGALGSIRRIRALRVGEMSALLPAELFQTAALTEALSPTLLIAVARLLSSKSPNKHAASERAYVVLLDPYQSLGVRCYQPLNLSDNVIKHCLIDNLAFLKAVNPTKQYQIWSIGYSCTDAIFGSIPWEKPRYTTASHGWRRSTNMIKRWHFSRYSMQQRKGSRAKRNIIVLGDPSQVQSMAPQLAATGLLSLQSVTLFFIDQRLAPEQWSPTCRSKLRVIEGIVWVRVPEQEEDSANLATLITLSAYLTTLLPKPRLPIYVLLPCDIAGKNLAVLPVNFLPAEDNSTTVQSLLIQFIEQLAVSGTKALVTEHELGFEARLSAYIEKRLGELSHLLSTLVVALPRRLRLDGVIWWPNKTEPTVLWQQFTELWIPKPRFLVTLRKRIWANVFGFGLAISVFILVIFFFSKRIAFVNEVSQLNLMLARARSVEEALPHLQLIQTLIQTLLTDHSAERSWFVSPASSQDTRIVTKLVRSYGESVQRWVMLPIQTRLDAKLGTFVAQAKSIESPLFPILDNLSSNTQRSREILDVEAKSLEQSSGEQVDSMSMDGLTCVAQPEQCRYGYQLLKTYLMLDKPTRADPPFLIPQVILLSHEVMPARLLVVTNKIIAFYLSHLARFTEWRVAAKAETVIRVRDLLTRLVSMSSTGERLYRAVLQQANEKYPVRKLTELITDKNDFPILVANHTLPGVYTREAWDNVIQQAIEKSIAPMSQNGSWVLLTHGNSEDITALKAGLTARYFAEYAEAWQKFLNGITWRYPPFLLSSSARLRAYGEAQRTALHALFSVIAYHAVLKESRNALWATVWQAAQKWRLVATPKTLADNDYVENPLSALFTPLQHLVRNVNTDKLEPTLAHYLAFLTSAYLQVQRTLGGGESEAERRLAAQAILKGKKSPLIDALQYASSVVSSLGDGLKPFAQQIFLAPLAASTQIIAEPALSELNELWLSQIFLPWIQELSNHYPLNDSDHDISISTLEQFIHPEHGSINRFILSQLAGVVNLNTEEWTPHPMLSGLALELDHDFLVAINRLRQVGNTLFLNTNSRRYVKLLPLSTPGIEENELVIDGYSIRYFNQKPRWTTVVWPGEPQNAGVRLAWKNFATGEQKSLEISGYWAWLRLLASAKLSRLDKTNYRLEWAVPENNTIRYLMQLEVNHPVLSLLSLPSFRLPKRVFNIKSSFGSLTRPSG